MIVTYDRVANNFEVTEVDLDHNHRLQLPQTCHLLASQRKIPEVQAFEIETTDDFGIMQKASHEYACRLVGCPNNLGYTCRDRKNHLRSKRQRELAYRQAARLNKKEVQSKNLRRKKNWLDKLLKGKHRVTKGPTKQGEKVSCNWYMICCYCSFVN